MGHELVDMNDVVAKARECRTWKRKQGAAEASDWSGIGSNACSVHGLSCIAWSACKAHLPDSK